jgi:hypothetical protein
MKITRMIDARQEGRRRTRIGKITMMIEANKN